MSKNKQVTPCLFCFAAILTVFTNGLATIRPDSTVIQVVDVGNENLTDKDHSLVFHFSGNESGSDFGVGDRRFVIRLPNDVTLNPPPKSSPSSTTTPSPLNVAKPAAPSSAIIIQTTKSNSSSDNNGTEGDRGLILLRPYVRPNTGGSTLSPSAADAGQIWVAEVPDNILLNPNGQNNNNRRPQKQTTSSDDSSNSGGLSNAAIGGIAGGCGAVVLIAIGAIVIVFWRTNKLKAQLASVQANSHPGRRNNKRFENSSPPRRRRHYHRRHMFGRRRHDQSSYHDHNNASFPISQETPSDVAINVNATPLTSIPSAPPLPYNHFTLPDAGRRLRNDAASVVAVRPVTVTTPIDQSRATAAALMHATYQPSSSGGDSGVSSTHASGSFIALL